MKNINFALTVLLCVIPSVAFGQAQTLPVTVTGVTGAGANITAPVGNGSGTSAAMPVNCVSGCSGGGGGSNVTVVGPLGSQASTAGVSVTIASDQAAVAVKQATAANLNATVVGTGTFPVQNTAATPAGTNLIGHVITDSGSVTASTQSPSSASTAGVAPISSASLEANHVIKGSAGNLYDFQVSADSTLSGAAWWIMIYNATSAPTDGSVTPLKCYALPLGATAFSGAFPFPAYFSTGIVIGVSTTGCFTKTASAHAFISGDAQ